MTFDQAVQLQPQWVQLWMNWLLVGAFILPVILIFWKQSRMAALFSVLAAIGSGAGVMWLFAQLGYVKIIGLPHLIFWTPLCFYLYRQIKRVDMPIWPKRIMMVVLATIVVALVFDYADVIRWLLGERQSFA